jgi:hypothetical protein
MKEINEEIDVCYCDNHLISPLSAIWIINRIDEIPKSCIYKLEQLLRD